MSSVRVAVADRGGTPLSKTVKVTVILIPMAWLMLRAQGVTPTDANWYAAWQTVEQSRRLNDGWTALCCVIERMYCATVSSCGTESAVTEPWPRQVKASPQVQ